jgi:hypothetical protein
MRLNSSSMVCLSLHSSADTYLHRPTLVVRGFGRGNWGFFVVFFFVDVVAQREHGGAAVAVGDGVFASSTLDIVILVVAAVEEDGDVRMGSVAGRLASNAHFFSCFIHALNMKSSAHESTTVFQNGGSACAVLTDSCWFWIQKAGHCVFYISKSGCVFEVVAVKSGATTTVSVVVVGDDDDDIVIIAVGDGQGKVRGWACDDIPVGSRRTSGHGRDARVGR